MAWIRDNTAVGLGGVLLILSGISHVARPTTSTWSKLLDSEKLVDVAKRVGLFSSLVNIPPGPNP